jgi:hypothetical protein
MENSTPKMPINIKEYASLIEKNSVYRKSSNYINNCIYTFEDFDRWFSYWTTINEKNKYQVYFRGMSEAKYKLYNSAQRTWLSYEMQDWNRPPNNQLQYKDFVMKMITDALDNKSILEKVFRLYGINGSHKEFPCLSLLQHYGAPTPLLDWSYNLNVALFFATEHTNLPSQKIDNELDDYFSIYVNGEQTQEIQDIENHNRESVSSCFPDSPVPNHYNLLKLTDINTDPEFKSNDPFKKVLMSTIYNQNIIPQEGLFIFNPYPEHPMEDLFKINSSVEFKENGNHQSGFIGYNIHKRLAEYVKRKIGNMGITKDYIYPNLSDYSKRVKERVLNGLI